MTKSPKITTNEGPGFKTVRIMAEVVRRPDSTYPVVMTPHRLDLSQYGEKSKDETKFTIHNVSQEELELTLVSAPSIFEVKLPSKIKADSQAEASVRLKEAGIDEAFEKSITFEVNDEQHSRFTIPVRRLLQQQAEARDAAQSQH